MAGIANVAAFGHEVGIPSKAGMPQMFANGFNNVAALVSDIDYTFKEVEEVKTFLEDLDAYAAANPVAAVATGGVLIISHNKESCEALVKGGYLTALGDFVSDFHGVHPGFLVTYRSKFVHYERVGILFKKHV